MVEIFYKMISNDEHGIAVGTKTVVFFERCFVGLHHKIVPAESSHHHQQGGVGQVKVGDHPVGNTEIVGWKNKFVGPSFVRFQMSLGRNGAFKGPALRLFQQHKYFSFRLLHD